MLEGTAASVTARTQPETVNNESNAGRRTHTVARPTGPMPPRATEADWMVT